MIDDEVIFNHSPSFSSTYFLGHVEPLSIKPTAMMEAYGSVLMVFVVVMPETKAEVVVAVN